jgi:RHS repeat-associated protein
VNGQSSSSLTTQPTCTTAYATTSAAGSSPSTSCSGAVDANYAISYVAGKVTVTQAALTITASSATVSYGAPVPTITPLYSGWVNGQSSSSLTTQPTCATAYTTTSAAGTSPSTSCSGAVDANYTISYVAGTVTVTQVTPTLTVASSSSPSTYAGSVTLTATISSGPTGTVTFYDSGTSIGTGTISGATATLATTALAVGAHTITAGWAGNTNYSSVTSSAITQTVSQAALTITASSATVSYGAPVPTITPLYSGWVNGQSSSSLTTQPTCTTAYTTTSAVGSSPSTSCSGAVDANYSITYVAGAVTITQVTPTLTVASSSSPSTYAGSVTFTATISSGPTGTVTFYDSGTLIGTGTISGTTATLTTTALAVGAHTITAGWAGNTNYSSVTSSAITQTVSQAALTITASSATVSYGAPVPTITPLYSGWVNGQSSSSLTTQPTCTTAYATTSAAGSSPSTSCSGAVDANYTISYVAGTVTITQSNVILSCSPTPITYGTPLSVSQLGCTSGGVSGSYTLTPAAGTVLTAGAQSISVSFTPTDATDYGTASATVQLTVSQAVPVITWTAPAAINSGTALSAAQLDATSTVAGTFAYTPAAGTVLAAGTQTLSVIFTPTDTVDYTTATDSVPLTVNQTQCTSNGYSYQRAITIDHTQVPNTDQTNFPFLFNTTDPLLATTANGGHVNNSNGYDIIFTSDPAGQNILNYEMEKYNPATGQVIAWVRIPTLSHTTDTVIYVFYRNPAITASQQNPTGVWDSNFVGVWHLPNGTNLSGSDSTANGNSLTVNNATPTTGIIDGAAGFSGGSSLSVESGMTVSAPFTIEEWAFPNSAGGTLGLFGSRSPSDGSFDAKLNGSGVHGDIGNGASWLTTSANGAFSETLNSWHHVAYVVGASDYAIYADGEQVGSGSLSGIAVLSDNSHKLSFGWTGSGGEYFSGNLDEARVSNSARSSDWITTEYANQSSPGTFYSLSPENQAIVPSAVMLFAQQSQQYTVTAIASCPASFVWSINPSGVGTLTQNGTSSALYTAPAEINTQQTLTITATNTVSNDTLLAVVTLMPPTVNPKLSLAPVVQPPYVVGASQTFVGTFTNLDSTPLYGIPVTFIVTGANSSSGTVMTDANGVALFKYTGMSSGIDTIQATGSAGSAQATSNKLTASWIVPSNPVSTTTVLSQFFPLTPGQCCWFDIPPGTQPVFSQAFPTIDFNPPSGSIPGNTTVGVNNQPFTDVTVDKNGNFSGSIIAQGNGYQAGVGQLSGFEVVFTGSFIVAGAGDVEIPIYVDNSFILGIGGGATRVSGPLGTQSRTTPFEQYPVMGSLSTTISGTSIIVDFPGPGTYPFELDYVEDGLASLSLIMTAGTPGSNGLASGVPSAGTLMLSPSSVPAQPVGGRQSFTVVATDAAGNPVPSLNVGLVVSLNDTADISATTDNTGTATFTYVNSAPGTDQVQAVAMIDGMVAYSNQVSVPWTLPGATTSTPIPGNVISGTITALPTVTLPNSLQLTGSLTDTGLNPGDTLTSSWSMANGPGTVTFSPQQTVTTTSPQQLVATATFSQAGVYILQLSASDSAGNSTSGTFSVTVNPVADTPQGWVGSPLNGSTVSGIVPITLASGVSLQNGVLTYYPANNPNNATVLNANTTGSGQIGILDTTTLPNGSYWIHLEATDSSGNLEYSLVQVTVVGNNKPGRVTATVTDLVVPATGLAINIQRTYDSLNAGTSGDFGYGWNLGINVNLVVDNLGNVTFTLNGQRKTFNLTPQFGNWLFPYYFVAYTPEPGLHGTLSDGGSGCALDILVPDGSLWYCQGGGQYSPTTYIYTDPSGTSYTIGAGGKLQSIQDHSGNGLTITSNGITSTTGLFVPFVRDAQNRITQITDPQGNIYSYGYDANGNLATVTYPAASQSTACPNTSAPNTSTYTYNANHYYLSGTDGRCNPLPVTAYYDSTTDGGNSSLDGRLLSVTDSSNNTTSYAYILSTTSTINGVSVPNTGVTTITYPDTGTATMIYDSYGMLLSSTDPLGNTTTNVYDANHNLISTTDPLGHTTTSTYDTNGNKTSSTYPATPTSHNTTSTTQYNQYSEPTSTTDELGNVRAFNYDANYNPQSVTDSAGTLASFIFNSNQTLAAGAIGFDITSLPAMASQFTYDANGNMTSRTDALGRTTSYVYNSLGQKTSMVTPTPASPTGNSASTTSYTYDALGNLTQTAAPLNRTTSYTYDANGNKTSSTDALGNVTYYQYDAMNRLIETDYPSNATTPATRSTKSYDFRNNVIDEIDQAGYDTHHEYDLAGRQTRVTRGYGSSTPSATSYAYDNANRKTSETDALGNTTNYFYDNDSRLTAISGVAGNFQYAYDDAGNRISSTDGKGNKTGYQYDARKRLIETDYPDETSVKNTYDGPGNLASVTDQADHLVQYTYDAANQLASVIQHNSPYASPQNTNSYGYDPLGNLTGLTDERGDTTSNLFDVLNELKQKTLPDQTHIETRTYDAAGNLSQLTHFNGMTTNYIYDALNRLLSRATPGEATVSFTYTATGKYLTSAVGSHSTNYSYNALDQLTAKATPQGTLNYTYYASGKVESIKSSNTGGTSVSYTYDDLNRLISVVDNNLPGQNTTDYTYDPASNVATVKYPSGLTSTFTYDPLNRLTALSMPPIADYKYTLGLTGNRTNATEQSGRALAWNYDNIYRLTDETITGDPANNNGNNGSATYTLDPVGNRTAASSSFSSFSPIAGSYNADDQLSSETYDANGNTTLAANGNSYTYDSQNHMTSATGNGKTIAMVYDAFGNRVAKTVNNVTTWYLVEDDVNPTGLPQVLEEKVGGAVQRVYTYGLQRISQYQFFDNQWTASFYVYDGAGSVRQLTDSNGTVTDEYEYDAYGNSFTKQGATPNNYLYRGEQFDSDLGLYYLRARYYNPATGRFLSRDPLDGNAIDPASLHKYLYANGDPVNGIDPMGRGVLIERALLIATLVAIQVGNTIAANANLVRSLYCFGDAVKGGWDIIMNLIYTYTHGEQGEQVEPPLPLPGPC